MENLYKPAFNCRERSQLVKMGGIPSLERFQAQSTGNLDLRISGQPHVRTTIIAALLLPLVSVRPAHGVTSIVVPVDAAAIDGNANNGFPYDAGSDVTARYQQVFDSSQFTMVPLGGALLTRIAFRPDPEHTQPFVQNHQRIRIDLSTTAKVPNALSATFAENLGANNATVFGPGPLTFSTAAVVPPEGPMEFDFTVPLTNHFFYDPAAGNLLMDVRVFFGAPEGDTFDAVSESAVTSRVYAFNVNAAVADVSAGPGTQFGLVTQFTFAPEPANPADFNEDGRVDGGDLAQWRIGFGTVSPATHSQGDADGDLDVDGNDFLAWQSELGDGIVASSSESVPEPPGLVSAVVGSLLLRRRR